MQANSEEQNRLTSSPNSQIPPAPWAPTRCPSMYLHVETKVYKRFIRENGRRWKEEREKKEKIRH